MTMKMKYKVYTISYNNEIIYWGRTNNLKRRQYEHNYHLRKGKENLLYSYLRKKKVSKITLKIQFEYKDKVSSKRMEMFQILKYMFIEDKILYQKIPNISDR